MLNKKISSEIAIGIILLLAIIIGGIFYWRNINIQQMQAPIQKACTMEAKLCADGSSVGRSGPNCEFAPCPENKTAQMANPASVYCVEKKGELEIRTATDGSQTGYCKFDNGSECEEWAYFRKECNEGNSNMTVNTSNWQKYTNTKYGFEFKYPTEVTYKKESAANIVYFFNINSSPYINLDVEADFKVVLEGSLGYECMSEDPNNEKIVINGQEYFSCITERETKEIIFTPVDSKVSIVFSEEFNSIFRDQILSTFKFTK